MTLNVESSRCPAPRNSVLIFCIHFNIVDFNSIFNVVNLSVTLVFSSFLSWRYQILSLLSKTKTNKYMKWLEVAQGLPFTLVLYNLEHIWIRHYR